MTSNSCFYTNDEDVTHLVDGLSPLYVAPPTTKEILRLFETSSDIKLSGYANTNDNRKVLILSVRAGILKSLIGANSNFETINAWLEKSDEMIRTVDVYIHC